METIMLQIKRLLIILLVLFCCCCTNNSKEKIYRTTVAIGGLQMFTDVDSYQNEVILKIPFKSKVELVDNKKYYIPDDKIISSEYSKVKYGVAIGYVAADGLSEKNDIPFIDDIKYDLPADEFDYDKMSAIKAFKKFMPIDKFFKDRLSYYYIDDPQMISLYGLNCDDVEIRVIAIIVNSKVASYYSRMICFRVENNKFVFNYDLPIEVEDKIVIEENVRDIKKPTDCYP
jgi:hypothetical protein